MCKTFFFFVLALFLTACSAPAAAPTRSAIVSPSLPTPSATLAPSNTPSATRTSALPTITPLPTIPTFAPTFDVRTVVTVTPAARAECPKEDPTITINLHAPEGRDFKLFDDFKKQEGNRVLAALNKGLSIAVLRAELKKQKLQDDYLDLTGDGVNDLAFSDAGYFNIFYCNADRYQLFDALHGDEDMGFPNPMSGVSKIVDLNKNGIPEIVFVEIKINHNNYLIMQIFEWNKKTFEDLSMNPETEDNILMPRFKSIEYKDINYDGLTDVVITGNSPYDGIGLWNRVNTTTYLWNGKYYVKSYVSREKPKYRYQAIQDGDRETSYGHYEKAIALYQEAIFSPDLDWMSFERAYYQVEIDSSYYHQPAPTAMATPIPDTSEYPRLAAYAYYRMIILHTYLGEIDAAQRQYETLQQKFPTGNPGHPYAEMATQFWIAYQDSDKLYDACASTIGYAKKYSKILEVLEGPAGDDALYYEPADVCPFR